MDYSHAGAPNRDKFAKEGEVEEILQVTAFTMLLRVLIRSTMKLVRWGDPSDASVCAGACRRVIANLHPRGATMSEFTRYLRDEPLMKPLSDVLNKLSKAKTIDALPSPHGHYHHDVTMEDAVCEVELLSRAEKLPPTRKPSFIGFPLPTPRPEYQSWFAKVEDDVEASNTTTKKQLFDQSSERNL